MSNAMATSAGELDQLTANNKSHAKRTTCDCTYLSETGNATKFTVALQELNARLKQAEMMIQTSTRINEDNARHDFPQIQLPQSSTELMASLPDSIEFLETNQEDMINSWSNMAACDFDEVFDQMEGEPQPREMNQNGLPPNRELTGTDQMRVSWDTAFALSNGVADISSSGGCVRIPGVIEDSRQSVKAYEDIIKKYFCITQKHLPLVDQDKFMQTTVRSDTSQAQALKCAVCMAGAHVDGDSHREEYFYKATRYHLEQAELEIQGSNFWSLEAAQALVLVARHDLTHTKSQRALVTVSRLDTLISILQRHLDDPKSGQALQVPKGDPSSFLELKRTIFLALSLKYRNFTDSQIHNDAECCSVSIQTPKLSPVAYTLPDQISILDRILPSKMENLDSFSIFMLALRITSDAYQHHRETAIDAAGPTVEYNYCHAHDRIDQEIGLLVSRLASTQLSAENVDNELSVLTMIVILGARIQLFNTAILHSSMAGFLKPVVAECLQQNVSTAKDISDMILQAQVLDNTKVAIYRETNFYIMPALALAAEAHMRHAQSSASKASESTTVNVHHYLSPDTRDSLTTLCMAMEACKDKTDRYNDVISECRSYLGASVPGKRLRTEFINLGRRPASGSE
ncbi:hypothetical protein ZTR_07176 [Talaromyces verruculosus]|nr:hypothetical protein ZTR_07176 [Talaromyces verruculosus]